MGGCNREGWHAAAGRRAKKAPSGTLLFRPGKIIAHFAILRFAWASVIASWKPYLDSNRTPFWRHKTSRRNVPSYVDSPQCAMFRPQPAETFSYIS